MPGAAADLIAQNGHDLRSDLTLAPYQMVWLDCRRG
jgi:amylosucrase